MLLYYYRPIYVHTPYVCELENVSLLAFEKEIGDDRQLKQGDAETETDQTLFIEQALVEVANIIRTAVTSCS